MTDIKYAFVTGRYLSGAADSPEDVDRLPNNLAVSGSVTFTPRAKYILMPGGAPDPVTILPMSITCEIDSEGYLSQNGARGLWLISNDTPANPSDWTWDVTFKFSAGVGGPAQAFGPFSYKFKESLDESSAQANDLTRLTPVTSSSGVTMTQGVGIADVVLEDNCIVVTLTDGTVRRTEPLAAPDATQGEPGRGIDKLELIGDDFIATYSTGEQVTVGTITGGTGGPGTPGQDGADGADGADGTNGVDGKDGRGIASIATEGDELVITYTDATTTRIPDFFGPRAQVVDGITNAVALGAAEKSALTTYRGLLEQSESPGTVVLDADLETSSKWELNYQSSFSTAPDIAYKGTRVLRLPAVNNNPNVDKVVHAYYTVPVSVTSGRIYSLRAKVRVTGVVGSDDFFRVMVGRITNSNPLTIGYAGASDRVQTQPRGINTDGWVDVSATWTANVTDANIVFGVQGGFMDSDMLVGQVIVADVTNATAPTQAQLTAAKTAYESALLQSRTAWGEFLPPSVTEQAPVSSGVTTQTIKRADYEARRAAGTLDPATLYMVTA